MEYIISYFKNLIVVIVIDHNYWKGLVSIKGDKKRAGSETNRGLDPGSREEKRWKDRNRDIDRDRRKIKTVCC